jgi:hypothetical protein
MSEIIPCSQNPGLRKTILDYAETLRTEAHKLGEHGLSETDFYQGGVFRGAIERLRGQFSAQMNEKRAFVRAVLDHMKGTGHIADWCSAGENNRHDYRVTMPSGRIACIELKGCLDGNNTNIFERPPHAEEFIIWSICTNPAADPRHNVWSGIHTRLSAEIIEGSKVVDGLIVWDWFCGTVARPCPKLAEATERVTRIDTWKLPPPCVYLFPRTIPSVRSNPSPPSQSLDDVQILKAFHNCFSGADAEIHGVRFSVGHLESETVRTTEIWRNGECLRKSERTPIRRK